MYISDIIHWKFQIKIQLIVMHQVMDLVVHSYILRLHLNTREGDFSISIVEVKMSYMYES